MSKSEKARLEYILEQVRDEVYPSYWTYWINPDGFMKRHMEAAYARKHETHVLVKVNLQFHRGGSCVDEWVIPLPFHEWLCEKDPYVDFGEANGKHSQVQRRFHECAVNVSDDFFEVDSRPRHDIPCKLIDLYEQWEEEVTTCEYCGDAIDDPDKNAITVTQGPNIESTFCLKCTREEEDETNIRPFNSGKSTFHDNCGKCEICKLCDERGATLEKENNPKPPQIMSNNFVCECPLGVNKHVNGTPGCHYVVHYMETPQTPLDSTDGENGPKKKRRCVE